MADPLIIDVHMHVFESKEQGRRAKASYEGLEFDGADNPPPYSSYDGDVADAVASIKEAGASRAVMVHFFLPLIAAQDSVDEDGVGFDPVLRSRAMDQYDPALGERLMSSNMAACASVRGHPEILPFVCIDPWVLRPQEARDHLVDMVENHGARGIKLHSVSQRFFMGDERMWPTYEACVELGVPIVAHSGRNLAEQQFSEPRAFAAVYERFPDLKLVMAHLGNGSWRQTRELAEAFPNALFDTSEVTEWYDARLAPSPAELAQLIKDVGPDRIMLGTDFPWWSLSHCVERIMDLPFLSLEEKEGILGANAVRLLGI